MAFRFKDGEYKGKSYLHVQRIDPWYIRDLPKNDPKLWESMSQKQKNLCAMVKVEADDEIVGVLVGKIDSGITKIEIQKWFEESELSKGLARTTRDKYIQIAKKKYSLEFDKRQQDVIATHAWRYEQMYEERINFEPSTELKPHVQKQLKIDALVTSAEIIHAKERMLGLHDRAYMIKVRQIVDKETREGGRYLKHRINTSRLGIARLARLVELLEKYSYKENEIKQEIKVKQDEITRREGSMVDWEQIEKDQFVDVEKVEGDTTIETNTPVKRIALEKPPNKVEGRNIDQVKASIDRSAKDKLREALKKAGSKTVK